MSHPHDMQLCLGDIVQFAFSPVSTVVGIDRYRMRAHTGDTHAWDSFTLTSAEDGLFSRWWIANVPGRGAYHFIRAAAIPSGAVLNTGLSGLAELDSDGDARLSSRFSALATFTRPGCPGSLYSVETFHEGPPITFLGRQLQPHRRR